MWMQPLAGSAMVLGYKYFTDNSYGNSVQRHLKSAALAGGAIFGSQYLLNAWDMSDDNLEGVSKMLMKPAATAGLYTLGEKVINKNNDYVMNAVIGGGACVASSYFSTPINKYF